MGLRALKKEQTRQLIAETAFRLFADCGFDRVTVAEVAREAQVAEATVFNYFRTKEDLFYFRLEAFGDRLLEAIASRGEGETVLAAFRRFLLDAEGGLLEQVQAGDTGALERLRTVNRVIAASPALLAREQQALARTTDALADLLGGETGETGETGATGATGGNRWRGSKGGPGDEITARVAANALMGVHRALIDHTRRRVLADDAPDRLAADVRRLGRDAFRLLERGLGDYAAKPPAARR
jgi:AcrR family transcriptional regulator